MFINAIKEKLQKQRHEKLQRLKEIEQQAQRFEQLVLEAMQSVTEEDEADTDSSGPCG